MVRAFEVSVDLRAEKAVRERVVRVARNPRRPSAFNGDERRTCVRAVVRTATTHDVGIALSESNSAHGRGRSGEQDGDRGPIEKVPRWQAESHAERGCS